MQLLNINQRALLALIQNARGSSIVDLSEVAWDEVDRYAREQGVLWMAYLGSKALKHVVPVNLQKTWRSATHSGVLYNDQTNAVQATLIQWLAQKNIRVAVLKGTSCSRYYRFPEVRPLGDIDILIDEENVSIVGAYLEEQGYAVSKHDHSFHIGYHGKNAVVEVHYAVTIPPSSKGGRAVADEMKLFLDEAHPISIGDSSFPVLSESHQALMLLLHMERHMVEDGIGLRQLCDWAEFVNGSSAEHWERRTLNMLERCGMLVFAKALTKTCITYIGLDAEKATWAIDVSDETAYELVVDIFRGGNMGIADTKGMGSLFTDRATLGNTEEFRLIGLFAKLSGLAYKKYPFLQRKKILLPVYFVYIPLRYFVRSLLGLRPKRSASYVISAANRRHKLYKDLQLYKVD